MAVFLAEILALAIVVKICRDQIPPVTGRRFHREIRFFLLHFFCPDGSVPGTPRHFCTFSRTKLEI